MELFLNSNSRESNRNSEIACSIKSRFGEKILHDFNPKKLHIIGLPKYLLHLNIHYHETLQYWVVIAHFHHVLYSPPPQILLPTPRQKDKKKLWNFDWQQNFDRVYANTLAFSGISQLWINFMMAFFFACIKRFNFDLCFWPAK